MKKILLSTVFSLAAATAMASEVYIDQAGGALNVDILQENGNNRVNVEDNPFNIEGNDISVTIVQDGDGNEADLELESGADSTTLIYNAAGDYNSIIGQIFGGIANSLDVTIIGSSNAITYCKDYTNSSCNGIIANNTTTTVALTGNDNELNLALDSSDSTNTINIGQNTPSDLNITNLTQISANGYDTVTIDMDGDSNTTDITQNTTGGNNTVTMAMTGGNNTTDLTQTSTSGYDSITLTKTGSNNTTTMTQNAAAGNNVIVMDLVGSSNITAFTQTGAGGYNQITMDVDGDSNEFTFDQQTPMGYTYITGVVQGNSNIVNILQN